MVALVILCLVAGSAKPRADVRSYAKETTLGDLRYTAQVIEIHGFIQQDDVARLATILQTAGPGAVKLNSPGGDVMAAMALGRVLRREQRSVVMGPDDQCVSACVFVLAGAIERGVFSEKVGIHRPFLVRDTATTPEQQKGQYANIEKLVKSYLAEMNVDQRLYDDMLRISPQAVRYLTEEELKAYGLFGTDPFYEQANLANRAAQLGISIPELLRRRKAMSTVCGSYDPLEPLPNRAAQQGNVSGLDFLTCLGAIEYGLSPQEYDRRDAVARRACASLSSSNSVEWSRCHDRIIRGFVTK